MHGDALAPAPQALVFEACRLLDRLDRLDGILSGRHEYWATIALDDADKQTYRLSVDNLLAESRAQMMAFRSIVTELRHLGLTVPADPHKVSFLEELAGD